MEISSDSVKMGRRRAACAVVACAMAIAATALLAHRHAFTLSPGGVQAYRLNRLTGSVARLAPCFPWPDSASRQKPDLRQGIIRLVRSRSSFHRTCRTVLLAGVDSIAVQGWRIRAVDGSRLVPWDSPVPIERPPDRCLVSYTYVLHEGGVPRDTLGWHWEVFPGQGIVRQVSGNLFLERKYDLSPGSERPSVLVSAQSVSAKGSQQFVASPHGRAYHLPDCRWVAYIPSDSLLFFSSGEEAEAAGLRACRTCEPHLQSK